MMTEETWQRRSELPLAVAALVFLGAYAWPILDLTLDPGTRTACSVATWAIWAAFAIDYLARLTLTTRRLEFARKHLFDLAVIALPLLRPLRLLRLVALLRVANRGATMTLRGRIVVYVVGAVGLVVLVGSLAELDAERGREGATISTFGDALWWSSTTITTVGYGDRYPVTAEGRFVAVGLMVAGIALLGIVTATLATWLLDQVRAEEEQTQAGLVDVAVELRLLRARIEQMAAPPSGQDSQPNPSSSASSL